MLDLKDRFGKSTEGLSEGDDVAAGSELSPIGGEGCSRALDLDVGDAERIDEARGYDGIGLLCRYYPGIGLAERAGYRVLSDGVEVCEIALAEDSGVVGDGEESFMLVVDNVTEMPPAALPGIRKIPGGNFRVISGTRSFLISANAPERSIIARRDSG
jgi:hypothetical protein